MTNNCPNCGAIIEPYNCKCKYCGTWYYDLTLFDTLDEKPRYIKFRANINGQEVYLTGLMRPILESVEFRRDAADFVYANSLCMPITVNEECDVNVRFECYADRETGSLFQIQKVV